MDSPTFTRIQCWRDDRVDDVIDIQAESVDLANFLATHVPLNTIRYKRSPSAVSSTSEGGFLNELLERGREGHHTFAVVLGAPGTGKSHLIRWLKERYEREYGDGDVVLLVERAQGNLRDTLKQLLAMPIFDTPAMRERLELLRMSVGRLSDDGLADVVLTHLMNSAREAVPPAGITFNRRIVRRLERFLLDAEVRAELKRPGGGIDRIVHHLSSRGGAGSKEPAFEAGDFAFPPDLLARMGEGGYEDATKLVRDLEYREGMREELATYLNVLLPSAISRSAALSATDLREVFFDLRRYLRTQGRGLALFVEDITAFTGLDEGLIDVLSTSHTGENDRQYCRLTSVIGITNYFYHSRFPDNVRDRVTFLLTLNREDEDSETSSESDLLTDSATTARFAAQYLNALRLTPRQVTDWFEAGANPMELPNACVACRFREPCHANFGSASHDGNEAGLGYYPFNEHALWTMYQNLDTDRVFKTPRALVNSILRYTLKSHGYRVEEGTFPPERTKLGVDFNAPTLAKPAQLGVLERKAGADARRNESLAVFWGNRTIDGTKVKGELYVGGLSHMVFEAFAVNPVCDGIDERGTGRGALPGIELRPSRDKAGAAVEVIGIRFPAGARVQLQLDNSTVGDGVSVGHDGGFTVSIKLPGTVAMGRHVVWAVAGGQRAEAPFEVLGDVIPPPNPHILRLQEWVAGARLDGYEELRVWLRNALADSIDWPGYGISGIQVSERLAPRKLAIEGQSGRIPEEDVLFFPRNTETFEALVALSDLRLPGRKSLEDREIGGHLAAMGAWLRGQEPSVVAFVGVPRKGSEPVPLAELVTTDALLLAWHGGALSPGDCTNEDLLLRTLAFCGTELSQGSDSGGRSTAWRGLGDALPGDAVRACRALALDVLTRPQGRIEQVSDVRFIDAALGLDIVRNFRAKSWSLPERRGSKSLPGIWNEPDDVRELLRERLETVLAGEEWYARQLAADLDDLVGSDSADTTFQSVGELLLAMKRVGEPYNFLPDPELTSGELASVRRQLRSFSTRQSHEQRILGLANCHASKRAERYRSYLRSFGEMATRRREILMDAISNLKASGAQVEIESVERRYAELEDTLRVSREALTPVQEEEVVA